MPLGGPYVERSIQRIVAVDARGKPVIESIDFVAYIKVTRARFGGLCGAASQRVLMGFPAEGGSERFKH
jgi:hypothetical protein